MLLNKLNHNIFKPFCSHRGLLSWYSGLVLEDLHRFWRGFLQRDASMGWPRSTVEKGPQSNESYERENPWNRTISTVLWVHKKLPQSTVKLVLPSNESYESKTGSNRSYRTLATVLWVPLNLPAKSKRGRQKTCHKLSCRKIASDILWRLTTIYDALCQWNKEMDIVITCRTLTWYFVNCRDVCHELLSRFFFWGPSPSRRPLLVFAESMRAIWSDRQKLLWEPTTQLQSRKPHKPRNRPKIPARRPNSPYGRGSKKYPPKNPEKYPQNTIFVYFWEIFLRFFTRPQLGPFFVLKFVRSRGVGARFLQPFPESLVTVKYYSNTKMAVNSR